MSKINPAKFFMYCALIFGIISPFQSPDEDSHFKRAYVISKGNLFPSSQNGIVGYEIPTDMINYIKDKISYMGNRDKKYTYSEEIIDDRLPKDYSDVTFQNFSTVETTPIAYIAPATGIIFAKITTKIIGMDNISVSLMLHFARFFSLMFYVLIVFFAIKLTPILKKTFCAIGLLPMSLALATAISYDSVLIAISLLSTAIIFKLIFDDNIKKVSNKYIIIFGFIAYILLSIKTVYATILIPLIFVPKEKCGGKITQIAKCFGIIIAIAIALYIVNKIPLMNLQRNFVENNSGEQLNFVVNNPIEYLKIWLKTMYTDRSYYFNGIVGLFGLIDTYIPTIYLVIYIIGLFAIIVSDFSLCPIKFNWKYKTISVLGSIATIFAIYIGLYILWTSTELGVGAETISGVQGRYFIPVIPLVIAILSNSILEKNKKIKLFMQKILNNSYFVPTVMLCVTLLTVFLRFWC